MKDNVLSVPAVSQQQRTDALLESIERIERDRDSHLAQVEALNNILAQMRQAVQLRSNRTLVLPSIKPNEYQGMRAIDALETYLRQRPGVKIPLSRAVEDLIRGGVYPGKARGRQTDPAALIAHTIKISFPNKLHLLEWDPKIEGKKKGTFLVPRHVPPDNITIWLADGAAIPKRRNRKE